MRVATISPVWGGRFFRALTESRVVSLTDKCYRASEPRGSAKLSPGQFITLRGVAMVKPAPPAAESWAPRRPCPRLRCPPPSLRGPRSRAEGRGNPAPPPTARSGTIASPATAGSPPEPRPPPKPAGSEPPTTASTARAPIPTPTRKPPSPASTEPKTSTGTVASLHSTELRRPSC